MTSEAPGRRALSLVARDDGTSEIVDWQGRVVGWFLPGAGVAPEAALMAPPQVPGWPFVLGEVGPSTPTVADIEGAGRLSVAVASLSDDDPNTYVVGADGNILPGWPHPTGRSGNPVTVVDLDRDGRAELFIAAARLFALDSRGTPLPGWPTGDSGFAVIGVEDLDHDGRWEIAATDRRGHAFLWDPDGMALPGWPFAFPTDSFMANHGPALGDTDGDGVAEIAFPMSLRPSLYLLSHAGKVLPGFPIDFTFGVKGGVAMADVDGNGTQDLVVQESEGAYVLDGRGHPLPGWPIPYFYGFPVSAIGDIDDDGRPELVSGTLGGDARVFAYNHDGTPVTGFPVTVPGFSFLSQPTLGDVDGDGGIDIVLGGINTAFGARGRIFAWHGNGKPVKGFPFDLPDDKAVQGSSVTITDLDGDGDVDLLVAATAGLNGTNNGRVFAFDLGTPYDPTTMEWPTFAHDARHTSRYEPPARKVLMGVDLEPEVFDLDKPPSKLTAHLRLPAGYESVEVRFKIARLDFRPIRALAGTEIDSAGQGQAGERIVCFDGAALAAALRAQQPTTPGRMPVTVNSDILDGKVLTGFADLRTSPGPPPAAPRAHFAPRVLDIGGVPLGQTGVGSVLLDNRGGAVLYVRDLTVSGEGFSTTLPRKLGVSPGGSFPLPVSFRPPRLGAFSGMLRFATDDDDAPEIVVPLQATGLPEAPEIQISATRLAFGSVPVGFPVSQEIRVDNLGRAPLEIPEITTDHVVFTSSRISLQVPPLESRSFSVVFTPTAAEPFAGILRLQTNDTDEPDLEIGLEGSGELPVTAFVTLPLADHVLQVDAVGQSSPFSSVPAGTLDVEAAGDGTLYLASPEDGAVWRVAPDGQATSFLSAADGLVTPSAVTLGATGELWVADTGLGQILSLDATGVLGVRADLEPSRVFFTGMALLPTGEVAVCDAGVIQIRAVSTTGAVRVFAEDPRLFDARSCAVGPDGRLYVAYDTGSGFGPAVVRFESDGSFSVFADATDGLTTTWGLAFDSSGRVYVSDVAAGKVFRFAPDGTGTVFAEVSPASPYAIAVVE